MYYLPETTHTRLVPSIYLTYTFQAGSTISIISVASHILIPMLSIIFLLTTYFIYKKNKSF